MRAAKASGVRPGVVACGECAPMLLQDGRADAAVRLEELRDEFATSFNAEVFCAYRTEPLLAPSGALGQICEAHSAVHSQ